MRLSLHASVAHRRHSVFPVPVGDSKIALVLCKKEHKLFEAGSGLGIYGKSTQAILKHCTLLVQLYSATLTELGACIYNIRS